MGKEGTGGWRVMGVVLARDYIKMPVYTGSLPTPCNEMGLIYFYGSPPSLYYCDGTNWVEAR